MGPDARSDAAPAALGLVGLSLVAFAISDAARAWGASPDLAQQVGLVCATLGGTHFALAALSGRTHARWRAPAMLGLGVLAAGLGASIWLEGGALLPFAALGAALALLHGHKEAQAPAAVGIVLLAVRALGPDALWATALGAAGAVGVGAAFLLAAGWRGPSRLLAGAGEF